MTERIIKMKSLFLGLIVALVANGPLAGDVRAQEKNVNKPKFLESPIRFDRLGQFSPLAEETSDAAAKEAEGNAGSTQKFTDLAYGAYQRGYYLTALKLALPRAESGDPAAQTLIAELYYEGLGVAKNRKKAASWYEFAAKAGNREAQFSYANMLARGKSVPLDKKAARKFMKLAADAGHFKAQFNLAQMIVAARPTYNGFAQALPYYRQAAESGISDAQYAMAHIHASGNGVPTPDIARARKWMTLAAINGFDSAQVELAIWLAIGKGGAKDEVAALKWFRLAAEQGNVIGQNRLARMYAYGLGTKRDVIEASKWHILAKRAGKNDQELDTLFRSLSAEDQKRAITAANLWRS